MDAMTAIGDAFETFMNPDCFAQPKQTPSLDDSSSGILQGYHNFTSVALSQYNHSQTALKASNQQQLALRGFYEMTVNWDDASFDCAPSSITGPAYYGPFTAQTIASPWSSAPPQSQSSYTPGSILQPVRLARVSSGADEGLQHPREIVLPTSTLQHRPQNKVTFPHVFMAQPDVSPISAVSSITTTTSLVTPTSPTRVTTPIMSSPNSYPIDLNLPQPPAFTPSTSTPKSTPTRRKQSATHARRGRVEAFDDADNMRIYAIRRQYHMKWDDMATLLNGEDAKRGIVSNWTHASVYNRWCRNAKAIHQKYFRDDKGFNYLKFKYQKKVTSSGKGQQKRKLALRVKTAKFKKQDEHKETTDQNEDDDEEMLDQHEEDQDIPTTDAANDLSAQSGHTVPDTSLTIRSDDLVTLHLTQQQALDALKPQLWGLMADMMNLTVAHDDDDSKRWTAEDCEAAIEAGDV